MGIAAAIMAGSILLSRIMGLVRDKVISFYYGASLESDIYFASFVVPDFLNYLLAGGYFSITLIPLLSEYFEHGDEEGWGFFSTVLTWVSGAVCALTAGAMLFSPQLALLAAPGFEPEAQARLAYFLRIVLPAQVFFLNGACWTAILYMRKQFTIPALSPLIYNMGIILGGVLMLERGMEGFCWGVLAGSFIGNFLLPCMAVLRADKTAFSRPKLRLRFRHDGIKRFILLALPLMIGQSIVVLDEQFLRVFGSLVAEGAVSWLNYARRIMLVPVGVVAQAAGVASYPFLAQLAARDEKKEFDETLSTAMQNTVRFLIPLSAWMIAAARPTIQLIFEQGGFSAQATDATALCLQIMLAGVFCWGVQQLLGRAFYACKDTLTPAVCGTVLCAASLPIYYGFAKWWGAVGVAGASALAVALYTAALMLIWRRKKGAGALAGLTRATGGAVLASLPAMALAWALVWWLSGLFGPDSLLGAAAALAVSFVGFAVVYGGAGVLFARESLAPFETIAQKASRKFLRK